MAVSSLAFTVLTAIALVTGGCGNDSGKPAPTASPAPVATGNPREEAAAPVARARAEAIEEFRWLVTIGRPGRPEVDSARRWLAESEATAPATTTASQVKQSARPALRGEPGATGTVGGRLTWPGIPDDRSFAIRVIVEGSGGSRKIVRSKLNARYSIDDLPQGTYRLTAAAGSLPVWKDVSLSVSSGEQTNVDLTPANAAVSPAEFPAR